MHEMDGNLRFLLNGGYLKNHNAVFEKYGRVFPKNKYVEKWGGGGSQNTTNTFPSSRRGAGRGGARGTSICFQTL